MLTITLDALLALQPCNPERRAALFNSKTELNMADALAAGVTVRDALWVLGRLKRKDICVKFAIAAAQRVVHLSKSPTSQAAINAAQVWVDNPCEDTRRAADAAYAAAYDAAYAAAAAYAYAAYAAYAAAYAAAAAAADADADADAADAADAAADAADAAERAVQKQILIDLCAKATND